MRVNLVSRDNGVGLTHDMRLLRGLFEGAGHTVTLVDWRAPKMAACDVVIFLELFNPNLLRYARGAIGVFNLEWFVARWKSYLPRFKQLWAKSREAEHAYHRMGLRNVHYTGFLSRDMLDLAVPRQQRALHLAGHSRLKNTDAVIRAWRDTPWLPPLTIVSVNDYAVPDGVALLGRQTDDALKELMNSHAIHLCPSRTEGWGHYIAEGMSTRATVITTDASPMNEHIGLGRGLLISPASSTPRGRVEEHHIAPKAIAAAVEQAASLSHGEREQLGGAARVHFEGRNAQFSEQALRLLRRI